MINEADLLLNNEVKVTSPRSQFWGEVGIVQRIMADGRTLEILFPAAGDFNGGTVAFVDVTLVGEVREPVPHAKGEPDLGPVANSVVQAHK